jgi:hypothetical protein
MAWKFLSCLIQHLFGYIVRSLDSLDRAHTIVILPYWRGPLNSAENHDNINIKFQSGGKSFCKYTKDVSKLFNFKNWTELIFTYIPYLTRGGLQEPPPCMKSCVAPKPVI